MSTQKTLLPLYFTKRNVPVKLENNQDFCFEKTLIVPIASRNTIV
jgi:hypothetical protein